MRAWCPARGCYRHDQPDRGGGDRAITSPAGAAASGTRRVAAGPQRPLADRLLAGRSLGRAHDPDRGHGAAGEPAVLGDRRAVCRGRLADGGDGDGGGYRRGDQARRGRFFELGCDLVAGRRSGGVLLRCRRGSRALDPGARWPNEPSRSGNRRAAVLRIREAALQPRRRAGSGQGGSRRQDDRGAERTRRSADLRGVALPEGGARRRVGAGANRRSCRSGRGGTPGEGTRARGRMGAGQGGGPRGRRPGNRRGVKDRHGRGDSRLRLLAGWERRRLDGAGRLREEHSAAELRPGRARPRPRRLQYGGRGRPHVLRHRVELGTGEPPDRLVSERQAGRRGAGRGRRTRGRRRRADRCPPVDRRGRARSGGGGGGGRGAAALERRRHRDLRNRRRRTVANRRRVRRGGARRRRSGVADARDRLR